MKIDEVIVASGVRETALPPDVVAAFDLTGDEQRGGPEIAMTKIQSAMGGGVLNPVVEHVGDILHRMTRMGQMAHWGLDAAAEKIEKTYRWMTHHYGFEREFNENCKNNAEYTGIPLEQFMQTLDNALQVYAQQHSKLRVYNRAQWLAREASISLGRKRFHTAEDCLRQLLTMANSPAWATRAHEFRKDENGQLLQYPYPRKYLQSFKT